MVLNEVADNTNSVIDVISSVSGVNWCRIAPWLRAF
jgi:hypothetical protein